MSEGCDATPQSARRPRLGLGRRACNSTPLLRLQNKESKESSTETPKNETPNGTPKGFPLSLSARRLGLSKNRTELTKKRLEFPATEKETQDNKQKADTKSDNKKQKRKAEVKVKEPKKIESQERVSPKDPDPGSPKTSKIIELQGDIAIWRQGFVASFEDLHSMLEPKPTKRDLLVQLGIPLEMLRYLEEDQA
ncbi:hypothetical protein KR018_003849 [Drosophila ironensis]|nr:hypothetical protein KR018_003849 [Drosophila ironensis]